MDNNNMTNNTHTQPNIHFHVIYNYQHVPSDFLYIQSSQMRPCADFLSPGDTTYLFSL